MISILHHNSSICRTDNRLSSGLNNALVINIKSANIITKTYVTGQDALTRHNGFSLLSDDGAICEESIYCNIDMQDKKLFRPGAKVEIIYVRDELKMRQKNGEKAYNDIVLEMAVSLHIDKSA